MGKTKELLFRRSSSRIQPNYLNLFPLKLGSLWDGFLFREGIYHTDPVHSHWGAESTGINHNLISNTCWDERNWKVATNGHHNRKVAVPDFPSRLKNEEWVLSPIDLIFLARKLHHIKQDLWEWTIDVICVWKCVDVGENGSEVVFCETWEIRHRLHIDCTSGWWVLCPGHYTFIG
jgi:hypothetical protein